MLQVRKLSSALAFYNDESTMHHSEQYLQTKYTPRSDKINLNDHKENVLFI